MHSCNDTTSNVISNKVVSHILVVLSLHAVDDSTYTCISI